MKAKLVKESLSLEAKEEIVSFLEETELGITDILRKNQVEKSIGREVQSYVRSQMNELVSNFILNKYQ